MAIGKARRNSQGSHATENGSERSIRRRCGSSYLAFSQTFEDVEGLLVNSGIINALLLSFCIPLLVSIDRETYNKGDFQYALLAFKDFRAYVIDVMDHEDIGTYERETFNWTVRIDVGKTIDVKSVLLNGPEIWTAGNSLFNRGDQDRLNLMAAYHALADDFPMRYLRMWCETHPDYAHRLAGASDAVHDATSISVALLTFGVMAALFLYVSLQLSPSRGDGAENKKAFEKWIKIGKPMTVFLYLNTIFATFCFFYGFAASVNLFAPHLRQQTFVTHVGLYTILVPGCVLVLLVSGITMFMSTSAAVSEGRQASTDTQMSQVVEKPRASLKDTSTGHWPHVPASGACDV